MNHTMNIYVARDYGVNEALMLNNIYFWVQHNKANNQNYHDGYHWVYNSAEAFTKLFIYLTKRQIEYALNKLEKNGLIKTGIYNKHKYDRTRWYTTTEKAEIYFKPANELMLQNCNMNVTPLLQDVTPLSHDSHENVTPIPDINADKNYIYKPDIISSEKKLKKEDDEKALERKRRDREVKELNEWFKTNIWERYPKQHRVGEKICFSKLRSAIRKGETKEDILEGFDTYINKIEILNINPAYIKRLDNWFASETWKNPDVCYTKKSENRDSKQKVVTPPEDIDPDTGDFTIKARLRDIAIFRGKCSRVVASKLSEEELKSKFSIEELKKIFDHRNLKKLGIDP